jgi:copper homeostasis protein
MTQPTNTVTTVASTSNTEHPLMLELCVDDIEGALLAERSGLDRIEVCSALSEGGLTPSIGQIGQILAHVERVAVQVLIRPRPGHFTYDENEIRMMEADIAAILALDHAPDVQLGVVTGALMADRSIDIEVTRRLMDACGSTSLTFHRGFDQTDDQVHALDTLMELGIPRVLTSGGARTAIEGVAALAVLNVRADKHIKILAGGGIRPHNVVELVALTGVREVHFATRSLRKLHSPGHSAVSLVGKPIPTDSIAYSDATSVEAMHAALAGVHNAVTRSQT